MSAIGNLLCSIQAKVESSSKRPIFDLSRKFKSYDSIRGSTVNLRDVEHVLAGFRIQLDTRELNMLGDCYGQPHFSYPRFVNDLEMEPQQLKKLRPPPPQPKGVTQTPHQNQDPSGYRQRREPNPATQLGGGNGYSPTQPRPEDIERSIDRVQEWQQRNAASRQGNRGYRDHNDDNQHRDYDDSRGNSNRGGNSQGDYGDAPRRGHRGGNYNQGGYDDVSRRRNNADGRSYGEEKSGRPSRNDPNDDYESPSHGNNRDPAPSGRGRGGGSKPSNKGSKGTKTGVGGSGINAVRAIRDTPSKGPGGATRAGAKRGAKSKPKLLTNAQGLPISAPGCQVTRQDIAEGRVRQTRYIKQGAFKGQATALSGMAGPTLVETGANDGQKKRRAGKGFDIFAN
mmetsp:Transcript_10599/g.20086  ORF Transcript_10599/g.20086 Transcript_10599/m.20086 type:complete len:396 (-) Transcript_10599:320-1507(-)